MLISHNTFTYRKPQWYLRPIAWMARCQGKAYQDQDVDGYDMRIFWSKNGKLQFRHGIFVYDATDIDTILSYCNAHNKHVRLMLEDRNWFTHRRVVNHNLIHQFISICKEWKKNYPNITWFGGRNVGSWEVIYDFGNNTPSFGYCSSMDNNKWNDLFPWRYAQLYNDDVFMDECRDKRDYHFFDFV